MKVTRALVGAALLFSAVAALAQPVTPGRPLTLDVGPPDGPAPTDRLDSARRGLSSIALPLGALHVAWRRPLGQPIDSPPLALGGDRIVAVVGRSEVVTLGEDGAERWRASVGASVTSAPTATSNGTVLVLSSAGEVLGVRDGRVSFRTRIGSRGAYARVAPLPLDDGGAVIAIGADLVAIDARGTVRARVTLPEVVTAPPIAGRGIVLAVTTSGAVHAWIPGQEPRRVGSFGGAVDGAAALVAADSLVAVVDGARVVSLDLRRGALTTESQAPAGALDLGPIASHGGVVDFISMTLTRTSLVSLRGAEEVSRIALPGAPLGGGSDAGVSTPAAPPHVGPVADRSGAIAFAAPDGHIGVVSAQGSTELLQEIPCTRSWVPQAEGSGTNGPASGVAGLVPGPRGGLLVACDNGTLVHVVGAAQR